MGKTIDNFVKIFWGFILLAMVVAIGSGPTVYVEIVRLCILGMVGGFFIFSKYISRKTFAFGEIGVWVTMFVTALLSNYTLLILLPICVFLLITIVLANVYFQRRAIFQNPTA